MTTTWLATSHGKLPAMPISAKKRNSATPSTRCGIISGDRNRPLSTSRPGKR